MGKLGGREMTAASDLDLNVVYDAAAGAEMSDGPKPVSANQYYARLAQRLIAALTAPTAEGVLYEADMRLRPSGNKGPVATSLASFRAYQRETAWTWEKLALARARPICGDAGLRAELGEAIAEALRAPRDADSARADVLAMRRLMLQEHKPQGVWDIKRAPGGLVDVEFIAQFLQIVHAPADPSILDANTLAALGKLEKAGLIAHADGAALREAAHLYQRLTQVLRLCVSGVYEPDKAPAGLNRIVASTAASPDIAGAEALLGDREAEVEAIFARLIGEVA
jgi:glutamate-ammonia-ligase adenylyltransferase